MENEIVLGGLVRRRSEVAGELERAKQEVQRLVEALAHLDAVICQFDPGYPTEASRPKPQRATNPLEGGSVSRAVLEVLRQAGEPLTVLQITERVVAAGGLDPENRTVRRSVLKSVGRALRYQRTAGAVRKVMQPEGLATWRMAHG